MLLVRPANALVQSMEPWKLKKQGRSDELAAVLAASIETARIVGILLQPIVPSFSAHLLGN